MFIFSVYIFGFFLSPFAQATPEAAPIHSRTISVEGQAQVRVQPDRALIELSIHSKADNLKQAQSENDNIVSSITNVWTKDLALDPKHIQTGFFQVQPTLVNCFSKRTTGKCDPSKIESYTVHKKIFLELQDITKYKVIINRLFSIQISSIEQITFYNSRYKEHRIQARKLATLAAKEKAEEIAKTLHVKVGEPLTVYLREPYLGSDTHNLETSQNETVHLPNSFDASNELAGFAPSQVSIKAHVDIIFTLE